MNVEYLGNKELLELKKTAFLTSNFISSDTVLRCYDWASPIILVLARRMYKTIPEELRKSLAENRLLIISVNNAVRQSKATALIRNRYICELADEILFVGVTEQSTLNVLRREYENKQKTVDKKIYVHG